MSNNTIIWIIYKMSVVKTVRLHLLSKHSTITRQLSSRTNHRQSVTTLTRFSTIIGQSSGTVRT